MKKKLSLLFTLLTLCSSWVWADVTVTISDKTDDTESGNITTSNFRSVNDHKYGTYSNASGGSTFTTNEASGANGLTLTSDGNYIMSYYYSNTKYLFGLAVKPTDGAGNSATVTITAPTGYYIKSYSMQAISTTDKGKFTLTPLGASGHEVSSSVVSINQTVYASTATFTVTRKSDATSTGSELCFPSFTITLASTTMSGSYTLDLNSTTGNGTRTDGTGTTGNDFSTYTSTTSPNGLTLVTGSGNSMNWTATAMKLHSNGATYTLTAPSGYYIKGYKMSTFVSANKINTIKPAAATTATRISDNSSSPTIICVDDIYSTSTTFTRACSGDANKDYATTTFTVYLVPTYTVTYKVVDDSGNEMTSQDVESYGTITPSNPSSFTNAFVTLGDNFYNNSSLTGDAVTSVSAATTLYKRGTVHDCPVDFSTIGSPKWYLIHFGSENKTWFGVKGNTALTIKNQDQYDATDGYSWAFIGNPYGVKLYNKEAETYINVGSPTGTGAIVNQMSESDGTAWIMNGETITGVATDFGLQVPGKNLYVNAWNGGNAFGLWSTGTSGDNGSTLRVTNLETFDHKSFVDEYIQPYIDAPSDAYYAISSSQATSLSSNYGKVSYSASEYKDYLDALNAAIKKPATGYYVLKNVNTGTYLKMNDVIGVGAANTDANAIIKLTPSGTGFNLQIQGSYIKVPDYNTQVSTSETAAVLYAFVQSPGEIKVGTTDGAHSYFNYKDGSVKGYEPTTNTGWWILEDAPSAINIPLNTAIDNTGTSHTYATLCVPFNITDLTGVDSKEVKAYVPTKSGDYIVPGEGATTVTEGTPVLLIGEEGATSVTATIGSNYATAPATTNVLTGVFAGAAIDTRAVTGTNYVLGKDASNSDRIGFYHVNNENFALKANRAYLKLDGSGDPAHVKGFVISFDDEDATAIANANVNGNANNATIYNIAGQRLSKMQKGINIVNGKKILK